MNRHLGILVGATVLTVCVSLDIRPADAANLPPGVEIRAFLNDTCIVSDEPYYLPPFEDEQVEKGLELPGVIVGKAAFALLNGIIMITGSALENLSRQKDLHYVAAYDFDLYQVSLDESPSYSLNDSLSCVTVVVASFEPPDADCMHRYVPKQVRPADTSDNQLDSRVVREDRSLENILRRANVCVNSEPYSVYEGRLYFSEDRTAFQIQSAGLWVNSLLSTKKDRADRVVIYMFDISEPGLDAKARTILTAAVPVGSIRAGTTIEDNSLAPESDWLQVPPMSWQSAQAYERDTAVHQDVYAEIQSLERSIKRNIRVREGLNGRLNEASPNVRETMQRQIEETEFTILHMESLLDARRAEYNDLPRQERSYMPVTIGVGVIESRTEKRALATLAGFLKDHRVKIADAASNAIGFERSLDAEGGQGEPTQGSELERTRTLYFDARVAVEEARTAGSEDIAALEEQLSQARDAYNKARRNAGIPPID
ncbi:MAG: hypothetical protein GWP60_02215 [Gammaproteobacteria bacterium]|jgi:hypothetical protein|nr:hypothetical protein [Gammaproteobacteria bacterium]